MRLFLAMFPDEPGREYFRDLRQKLSKYKRNFKFTPIDQIHLTIKFLGNDVSYETYELYSQMLKQRLSSFEKFEYSVQKVQFGFPGQLIKEILFAKVTDSPELDELSDIATEIAKEFGKYDIVSKKERNKLIHHFTLGRLKSSISKAFGRTFTESLDLLVADELTFKGREVALVESELTSSGPIYKILDRVELK